MSSNSDWKESGNMIDTLLKNIRPEFKDNLDEAWNSLGIEKHKAQINTFSKGTLIVKVTANAYMQELWFSKEEIIEKLNHRLDGVVKDIKFKLAGGF